MCTVLECTDKSDAPSLRSNVPTMITAETNLLDSDAQCQIASILEMELSYLRNELDNVSTQAAIIFGVGFAAICVPQLDGYGAQVIATNGIVDDGLRGWWQTIYVAIYMFFASLTCALSAVVICSSMFLTNWGSNEALRTKRIEDLTQTITSIRHERILTLRIFTISMATTIATLLLLAWVNWNEWASMLCTINALLGLVTVRWLYYRTKGLFRHSPPLFSRDGTYVSNRHSMGSNYSSHLSNSRSDLNNSSQSYGIGQNNARPWN